MKIVQNISVVIIFLFTTTVFCNAEGVEEGLRRGGLVVSRSFYAIRQNVSQLDTVSKFLDDSRSLFQSAYRTMGIVFVRQHNYAEGNPYSRGQYGGIRAAFLALWAGSFALSSDKQVKADDADDINIGEKVLSAWHQSGGSSKRKSGVLVVGNTKAGKSTLIASMMGAKLQKVKGKVSLDPAENPLAYPVIGSNSSASQTCYPQGFSAKDFQINGITFVDTPGLSDARGYPYDFLADVTLEYTVKSMRKSQLLLVAGYDELTAVGGKGFIDALVHFATIFPKTDVLSSVLLVVTKTDCSKEDIMKELKDFVETKRLSGAKKMISNLLKNHIGFKTEGVEKIDSKLRNKAIGEESAKKLLEAIQDKPSNLVVFDPLSEVSRQELFMRLKKLNATAPSEFYFPEESRNKFQSFSSDIMSRGFTLACRRQWLEGEGALVQREIDATRKELEVVGDLSQLKEQIKREINALDIFIKGLEEEKKQILSKYQEMEHDSKEEIVYDKRIEEERRWASVNWTVKGFEYDGSVITKIWKDHDENGRFRNWEPVLNDGNGRGALRAKYVGGWGANAWAHVKLYGNYNQQPYVVSLVASLKEQERFKGLLIKGFKERRESLVGSLSNPKPITAEELINKERELIKKKQGIEGELALVKEQLQNKRGIYEAIASIRSCIGIEKHDFDEHFKNFFDTIRSGEAK